MFKIISIQKDPGTIKAEEFRPIKILHLFEKILELVVKEQLMNHLTTHSLLILEQSGYREGHSCETALNLVFSKWKGFIEQKNEVRAVFLDLKRVGHPATDLDRHSIVCRMDRELATNTPGRMAVG